MAHPPRYTAELAERVLDQLRAGRRLYLVCGDAGMPSASTVHGWVNDDHDGFAAAYHRARETGLGYAPGYSADTAERILTELRGGRSPIDVCRDAGMPPYGTVRDWVRHNRHGFAAPYRAALRAGGARWARPTRYAEHIADCILDGLGEGRTLESICADPGMPTAAAVQRWVKQDRHGFAARYWTMREVGCDRLAGQLIVSADDRSGAWMERRRKDGTTEWVADRTYVRRARLRCDVIRYLSSRRLRDTYGVRNLTPERDDRSPRR
jgi:Bacteriophage Sf6, terminase small subunit-like